jgi:hypothetical protein
VDGKELERRWKKRTRNADAYILPLKNCYTKLEEFVWMYERISPLSVCMQLLPGLGPIISTNEHEDFS